MKPAVFEPRQDYNQQPAAQVLEYFTNNRIKNVEKYKMLTEADFTKVSLHPRLKLMMGPVDLAFFDAEHDDHHLVKIREIQDAFKESIALPPSGDERRWQ